MSIRFSERLGALPGYPLAEIPTIKRRLLDAGVMQIVAVTDPLQLGFPRQAMIGIRTTGDLEKIADRLAALAAGRDAPATDQETDPDKEAHQPRRDA